MSHTFLLLFYIHNAYISILLGTHIAHMQVAIKYLIFGHMRKMSVKCKQVQSVSKLHTSPIDSSLYAKHMHLVYTAHDLHASFMGLLHALGLHITSMQNACIPLHVRDMLFFCCCTWLFYILHTSNYKVSHGKKKVWSSFFFRFQKSSFFFQPCYKCCSV